MKDKRMVISRGNKTDRRETFRLIHRTVLPIVENRMKDTSRGQKEVWTAMNGEVNIKEF
jgi:hypothetical protein